MWRWDLKANERKRENLSFVTGGQWRAWLHKWEGERITADRHPTCESWKKRPIATIKKKCMGAVLNFQALQGGEVAGFEGGFSSSFYRQSTLNWGNFYLIYCQLAQISDHWFRYWVKKKRDNIIKHFKKHLCFPRLHFGQHLSCPILVPCSTAGHTQSSQGEVVVGVWRMLSAILPFSLLPLRLPWGGMSPAASSMTFSAVTEALNTFFFW